MENKQKWTSRFRLHNEFDELVNAFNNLLADSAITCQMKDYSRATVSFAVSTRPGFPTDGNPAIHLMEEGSVFDIAYWLDNCKMDIRALKYWIEYREMLENSDAGEYVSAPSLESFNEHPGNIIRPQVIKEINVRIGRMCEYIQSDEIKVRNIIRSIVEDSNRFRGQPSENRISDGQPAQQPGE